METTRPDQKIQCDACGDSGWVRREITENGVSVAGVSRCECLIRRMAARRDVKVYGSEYRADIAMESLSGGILAESTAYVSGIADKPGLLLMSDPGVGKSYMAAAIANELLKQNAKSLVFATMVPFLLDLRKSEQAGDLDDRIEEIAGVDILVLDDLGSEKPTEWTESVITSIISSRYSSGKKPIIITTNHNLEGLERKIGIRAMDRILGFCNGIPTVLEGPSRRWSVSNGKR